MAEIKQVKGEAQINIRKGKQIMSYDFSVLVQWQASKDAEQATGTFQLKDLTSLDNEFDVASVNCDGKTAISDQSKDIIKKNLQKALRDKFATFLQELATYQKKE